MMETNKEIISTTTELKDEEKTSLNSLLDQIADTNNAETVKTNAVNFMKSIIYTADNTRVDYATMKENLNTEGTPDQLEWFQYNIYLGFLLKHAGFLPDGCIDGKLGSNKKADSVSALRKAIGDFQGAHLGDTDNPLVQDYVPGPATIEKLLEVAGKEKFLTQEEKEAIAFEKGDETYIQAKEKERKRIGPTLADILADENKLKDIKEPIIDGKGIGECIYPMANIRKDYQDESFEYNLCKEYIGKNPVIDAYLLYHSMIHNGTNEPIIKDVIYKQNGPVIANVIKAYNTGERDFLEDLRKDMHGELQYYDLLRHISQFDETRGYIQEHIYTIRKGQSGTVNTPDQNRVNEFKKQPWFATNKLDIPPSST